MRTGSAAAQDGSWNMRPRTAALVVAAFVAALGASLAWSGGVTITLVAGAYVLLLIAVARAARERVHGIAYTTAALVVALISTMLVPLTWGVSLLLAAIGLPLAVPGLWSPGLGRWLALLALLLNAALAVLFVLVWVIS